MLKVIIADDEKWVRAAIRTLIPFEKLEMKLVGEASNGIEALELCRLHDPDIVLTDIMMPGLTGLDLIEELRKSRPKVKIAIISGYSDFEYAKAAMKSGINDYLLKPLEENELLQVLERFKKEIAEEMKTLRSSHLEKEKIKLAVPLLKEAFLKRLVSQNTFTLEKIKTRLQEFGIEFKGNTFYIAVFSSDRPKDINTEGDEEYRLEIIRRVMKRYTGAVTFPGKGTASEVISIISCQNGLVGAKLENAFQLCLKIFKKRFGSTLSGGFSQSSHQLCLLYQLFTQAELALDMRFWTGPGFLHPYNPKLLSREPDLPLSDEILNKIILNLKLSNIQTAFSHVDGVVEALKNQTDIKPLFVREYFWQLVQSIISILNIQLPFIRFETRLTGEQPYERILRTAFIDGLAQYTKELLMHVYDFFHDKNPVNNSNLIDNAKRIIEANYAGDISLEHVARHVHLSPAYLSELFKKETGMSFVDYKTVVRIENAKRLLDSTPGNISDISEKVGYSDPKYFSKLFKKITGKTVYEYRKESCS